MQMTRSHAFLSSEEYRIYPLALLIPLNSQVPKLPFTFTALRQLLNSQKVRAHSRQSRGKREAALETGKKSRDARGIHRSQYDPAW